MIKLFKKLLTKKKHPDLILVISFKYLGDTIFTIPAIRLLEKKYKNHRIAVLCSEENKILYELYFQNIQYIIASRREVGLESYWVNLNFLKICYSARKLSPQISLDLTSSFKSAMISFLSGAGLKVGFGNKRLKSGFDVFTERHKDMNMIDMFLDPVLKLVGDDSDIVHNYNSSQKKTIKNILIVPFAGWSAKQWGLKKFIDLGKMLGNKYYVLIASEADKIPADVIGYIQNCSISYKTTHSLKELIAEIKKCDLFIGNDSGPAYISNLLHKPVFAIFGPTNPEFHKPVFPDNFTYVSRSLPCSPSENQKMCFTFGGRKGCPSFECMNQLSVESVYNSLSRFISKIT